MIKNNFRILKKPHAYLQTILKAPVKFQKDRTKTVGGVKGTRYLSNLLKIRNHTPRATKSRKQCPSAFLRNMTKPTKWHVRPAKTQISLGIRPVWSESSLSTWRQLRSSATKTQIRLGQCPGWSESTLSTHAILLVSSWDGSIYKSG